MRSQSPLAVETRGSSNRRCRVIFSYAPQHDDELTISEGDIITVLHEVEEGWWKGLLNGQVGMFPSNFVEEVKEPSDVSSELNGNDVEHNESKEKLPIKSSSAVNGSSKIGSVNSAFHPINKDEKEGKREPQKEKADRHSKNVENFSNDKERMPNESDKITVNIGKDVNRKPKQPAHRLSSSYDSTPPLLPPKPIRELARVLYAYQAEHDDELELKEGDIISIISKELEDKGWWKGELCGKIGVFPDNFVELISSEEAMKPPRPEKPTAQTKHSPVEAQKFDPPPIPGKKQPLPSEKESDVHAPVDVNDATCGGNLTLDREHRLSHQTQNRPKGPSNRRPPSQTFLEGKKASSDDLKPSSESKDNPEEITPSRKDNSPITPKEAPWMKELKANQMKKKLLVGGNLSVDSPSPLNTTETTQSTPGTLHSNSSNFSQYSSTFSGSPLVNSNCSMPDSTPASSAMQTTGSKTSGASYSSVTSTPYCSQRALNAAHPKAPDVTPIIKKRSSGDGLRHKLPVVPPTSHVDSSSSTNGYDDHKSTSFEDSASIQNLRNELLPKIKSLEDRLSEQQQSHSRQLKMLMGELDDERKKRACLEIEIERLTKLVYTYVQV